MEIRAENAEQGDVMVATQLLQHALDHLLVEEAFEALEKGAVVSSSHVLQCARHVGDEFVPLLNALITASDTFTTTALYKGNRDQLIKACANPIGAVMMSMHLERWQRQDLTGREIG